MQSIKENKHLLNNIQAMFPLSCKAEKSLGDKYEAPSSAPCKDSEHLVRYSAMFFLPPWPQEPSLAHLALFLSERLNVVTDTWNTSHSIQHSPQGSQERHGYLWVD